VKTKEVSPETRRGVRRWIVREVNGGLLVVVILVLLSGDWRWAMAYALAGMYLLTTLMQSLLLVPRSPELLAERSRRFAPGTKPWDRTILAVYGTAYLGVLVVAALDRRWTWSSPLPVAAQAAGVALWLLGSAAVTWSMAANAFFSFSVRLQAERGQTVVSGGPYRFVRHPGYVGAILTALGAALLLGSAWSLVPAGLVLVSLTVRTALEDRTLRRELAGYEEFTRRTRWRLVPGVW
jgi:protein-S-isoprenylcysteine O-methyltransferase Ste14